MSDVATAPRVGPLLREWRRRRRLSQLDLALDAGVSARHLSFVETGRSRPSPDMVLILADQLQVPLRDRNQLLVAAGYAPSYPERGLDDPELAPVREAVQRVLDGHEPYPAMVIDRGWNRVAGNRSIPLLGAVAPELMGPPLNVIRVSLHPRGVAPRILNLGEWRAHLLDRLKREVLLTGDAGLEALYKEVSAYPGGEPHQGPVNGVAVPLRVRTEIGDLSFYSTVATFGTAVDVTVAELSLESFFPADARTREAVQAYAASGSGD
ncbi:MAG: helix-turn-helix transcriptional regulator [Candidatus Dormibacteraeota bacterium]|nr:helix-turn-helix transcriptional regulator [Candidatus Dormibacteraeota bacterium]